MLDWILGLNFRFPQNKEMVLEYPRNSIPSPRIKNHPNQIA